MEYNFFYRYPGKNDTDPDPGITGSGSAKLIPIIPVTESSSPPRLPRPPRLLGDTLLSSGPPPLWNSAKPYSTREQTVVGERKLDR